MLARVLLFVAALACSTSIAAETFVGRVVETGTGDTLTVDDGKGRRIFVRLVAAAAPQGKQPFAAASRQALSAQVIDREVMVFMIRKTGKGGVIAAVRIAEPACPGPACPKMRDIGLAQIAAGMARYDRRDELLQPSEDRAKYFVAEDEAHQKRLGLWSVAEPVVPREQGGGRNR